MFNKQKLNINFTQCTFILLYLFNILFHLIVASKKLQGVSAAVHGYYYQASVLRFLKTNQQLL